MIVKSRMHSFSQFSDWIGALTSINEGNYCVKDMLEVQVNTSKSHTATGKNFNKAVCQSSAQLYLHCALSGISRLNKTKQNQIRKWTICCVNTFRFFFFLQLGWSLQKGCSTVTEMVTYVQWSEATLHYENYSTWFTWWAERVKMHSCTKHVALFFPILSFVTLMKTLTPAFLFVLISAGGDGHQPHGVVSSQQLGQLLQPAPR